MRRFLFIAALALATQFAVAKVTLPTLLADNAILQQKCDVIMWGRSTGSEVIITPSWDSQSYTTAVDKSGRWECTVSTPATVKGESYTITFDDGQATTISNILLGEVWLCTGQSNMNVSMKGNESQPVEGSADMILSAKASTPIRLFSGPATSSSTPQEEGVGSWKLYTPNAVASFGATPIFFANYLHKILDIPVAVVNCSLGGSKIESWISREAIEDFKEYDFPKEDEQLTAALARSTPSQLYNGAMYPLKNLKFKGMIWYQGEANRANYEEYVELFKRYAASSRALFDCGEFPIYYAQLAPYPFAARENGAVLLRINQSKIMHQVRRTGMVVLSDAGEQSCIHPRYKREAGERFAYWALGDTYGYKSIEYRAPEFAGMEQREATNIFPKHVALRFDHAKMGLSLAADSNSVNFEVAGEDGVYYPAEMRLVSKNKFPIVLWSDKVKDIVAVRYGYKDYFKGDVFNNFGIPLSSFTSEDMPNN